MRLRDLVAPELSFMELAERQELVVNFRWESASTPAPVDKELVQVLPERNGVPPQPGDGVRNSGKPLQKHQWLDPCGKARRPLCRSGQQLVQRLQPAPVPEFGGIQRRSLV